MLPFRHLCAALLLALLAFHAEAQLAQNGTTTTSATFTPAALTGTFAHITPAMANRVLIVAVHLNIAASTGTTVASVTYGGNALAFGSAINDGANTTRTEVWFLIAPPTGSNSVVMTMQNVTNTVEALIGAQTWVDVDQALTGSLAFTGTGNSATPTSTLAGTTAGDIVFDAMTARMNAAGTLTAAIGAGQTQIYNTTSAAPLSAADVRAVSSRETSTGANVTMSYTLNATARWTQVGGSLRAARTDVSISGYATPDITDGSPTTVKFVFTITANSAGANNVNFTDTLPAGLTIVSATASQGTCVTAATSTCSLGNLLNAGDTAIVTIVATTGNNTAATSYSNSASITSGTTDAVAANNTATVVVRTQNHVCANPGKDGAAGTLNGIINTYYPGSANAAAGATSITLGAVPAGYGTNAIASGDLLLVMQMQDAAIDANNDDRYGDGTGTQGTGTAGSGSSNLNNAGRYEYVVATSAVPVTGGTLTFSAVGNAGLLYAYTNANATATQGQRRFQVIRVPQYSTATIAAGTRAPAWNGSGGGVFAIDVAGTLKFGSAVGTGTVATTSGSQTVTGTGTSFTTQLRAGDPITINGQGTYTVRYVASNTSLVLTSAATATTASATFTVPQLSVSGVGFRGGAGRQLAGGAGANTDYRTTAATATNGSKGEGYAGTPRYLFNAGAVLDTGTDGYPNGSSGRGAPGNAGGGATDGDPAANDENTGGGGGANGGDGGQGGNSWNSAIASGGFGGTFEAPNSTRFVMGGGGGAGATNNGTNDNQPNFGTTGVNSSGAPGGGIVIIRAGTITGTATIAANGSPAFDVQNDGAGGGGAGGTIVINSVYGDLSSVTITARGGAGGSAWLAQAAGVYPGQRHGPGGGGGGGVILLSSGAASTDVAGGANGLTTTSLDNFGASSGTNGIVLQGTAVVAGADAGYSCAVADLAVTNTDSPDPVIVGANITYTQVLTNNGPNTADTVEFQSAIPAGTTFQSVSVPAGWTCITPAVNGTGAITCTTTTLNSGASASFTLVVKAVTPPAGYPITDTASATSQTNDSNPLNNAATATTTTINTVSADVGVTVTVPATATAGSNIVFANVMKNNGGTLAASPSFSFTIPANTTFQSVTPPAGWTCITPAVNGTGTISCSAASLASGSSAAFNITVKVNAGTAPGTVITATPTVATTTNDNNSSNNTASASTTVVAAGSADFGVTMTAPFSDVEPGHQLAFFEIVTNNGVTAANATFTQNVPANTTFVSMATPAGWTCTTPAAGGTGTITCSTTAAVAVGASTSFQPVYAVTTGTASGTVITNSATVTAAVTDSIASNNTASASSTVRNSGTADLAITMTASPSPVGELQQMTYLLTITNNGTEVATGVVVSDTLPAGVTFVSDSTSAINGFCSGTTSITCSLDSLAVGASATVTIVVKVGSPTTISNTATVSGTITDPVSPNNSASTTTTIQAVTLVRLRDFAVTQQGANVLIRWQTAFESDNLGFNIWRDVNGQRTKVNKGLIAGSALASREQDHHAGYAYHLHDKLDAGVFAQYWLEDVDLHGVHTMHGPVSPVAGTVAADPNSNPIAGLGTTGRTIDSPAGIGVVRPLTLGTPSQQQIKQQFDLAGDGGLKIYVASEGWYRVTRAAMTAAGYDPGSDSRALSLYVAGIEQPIVVDDGGDGRFDAGDAIEFYGLPLDTVPTGARTYWLRASKKGGAARVDVSHTNGGDPLTGSIPFTLERKERNVYFGTAILNGDQQNFFGPVITSEGATQTLKVTNLDTSFAGNATLVVTVQGATDGVHFTDVAINGHDLGFAVLQFQQQQTFTFTFPQSWLLEDANTLSLQSRSGDDDVTALASTQLTYNHLLRADDGALEVSVPAGRSVTVDGFTSAHVRALDVTDPQRPIELETSISDGRATFTPAGNSGARTIFVFDTARVAAPNELAVAKPSAWNQNKSAADLVIITNGRFAAAASTLKPVREAEGISTAVADVDAIYDEFNFGVRDPQAIRTFIQTAWPKLPKYVLLVGDASFDPRDYFALGSVDYLPTKLVPTAYLKTASDDWFTDFNNDGVADIPVGRIPVRTSDEAGAVFAKLISRGTPSGAWTNQAVFVADAPIDYDFAAAASTLIPLLPQSMTSRTIALGNSASPHADVTSAFNDGAMLVDYIGHGSVEIWSDYSTFSSYDVASLTNGNRLPIVVAMTCLNGLFHDLFTESLAESLLKSPNGGAIAVWASSTLTEPDPQAAMNRAFMNALFAPGMRLGDAILRAKAAVKDPDVRRSWILFGDPSMKVK